MKPRSIQSILIPWTLMLAACSGAAEGQIEPSDQAPVSDETVRLEEVEPQKSAEAANAEAASLPEVRYYLIADT